MADATQKETTLAEANRELVNAINQTQQRCAASEAKLHRMRKYRALFQAAGRIECKGCAHMYPTNIFGAHAKLCQQLLKAEGQMQFLLTTRSVHGSRHNSVSAPPAQVRQEAMSY